MFNPGHLTAKSYPNQTLEGFTSHAEFQNECQRCHTPLQTTQADLCVRCHTNIMRQVADQSGSHAKLKNLSECRACHPDHQGRDFDPVAAAFTLFDHNQTNFTLIWHQVDYDVSPITCEDCHERANGFEQKPDACQSCHANHDPEFMAQHIQNLGADCLACHDGSGDVANFDHAMTDFPLEGMHEQIECGDCHTEGQLIKLPSDCQSCHQEPEIHAGLFSTDCKVCHLATSWAAQVKLDGRDFDHFDQTQFSLTLHELNYDNRILTCAGCHAAPDGVNVTFDLQFCVVCHANADQFFMTEHQQEFGTSCVDCHDGVDRMHNFDHANTFALNGAHADTECTACHVDQIYVGTPSTCAECHAEPEIHVGVFGTQCENCHSDTAWSPAQMVEHIFPLNHGEQGIVACETCHVKIYTEYTCYGCHEHQEAEILAEHREEGISQLEIADCMACHPDGREHDD